MLVVPKFCKLVIIVYFYFFVLNPFYPDEAKISYKSNIINFS